MKILEKILAVGILILVILKFSLIRGSDVLILWTILLLACIYYAFGFLLFNQIRLRDIFKRIAYKNVSTFKIVIAIVTGLGLSILCVGSLFKLINLTGADQMLMIGLIISFVILVITIVTFLRNGDAVSKSILWRTSIAGVIGLTLLLTSSLSIVKLQYRKHPAYVEAYAKYVADPTNEVLIKRKETEYYKVILTAEEFKVYENSFNN